MCERERQRTESAEGCAVTSVCGLANYYTLSLGRIRFQCHTLVIFSMGAERKYTSIASSWHFAQARSGFCAAVSHFCTCLYIEHQPERTHQMEMKGVNTNNSQIKS